MRALNQTNVGQPGRQPVGLVLHAEVDQLTQVVELLSATEPHLLTVCFHIVMHELESFLLGVEVLHLGILYDNFH